MSEKDSSKENEIAHYNAILLEEMRSEFRFVIDKMAGLEEKFDSKIDNLDKHLSSRIDDVEIVLKYHSKMLQDNEKRWEANDRRWEECYKKLDQVAVKVELHERLLGT